MAPKANIRHLLAIIILALSGVLAVLVLRNWRSAPAEEMVESLPNNVDLSLRTIQYTETREGVRRWTLVADSAAHSSVAGSTRIENIRMTFYNVQGHGDIALTAREGTMTEAREVELQGDVVVKSPRGYTVFTDQLHYREAQREIGTDAPVRIVSPSMETTGKGLRLNVETHAFVLRSNVKTRWSGEKQ